MDRRAFLTLLSANAALAQVPAVLPPVVMPPPAKAKITSSVALWVLEGSFEERVRIAANAGMQSVELLDEYAAWDQAQLKRAKRYIGSFGMLTQTVSATPNWRTQPVSLVNPAHRENFVADLRKAITAAQKLEAPYVILTSGNQMPGQTREEQYLSLLEGTKQAGALAATADITLLVHHLNSQVNSKNFYLNTAAEALKLVKDADTPHVRLLFSVYDEQVQNGSVLPVLRDALEYTDVLHMADAPGRTEPGTGLLNVREIYGALQKSNYTHVLGMEYKPKGSAVGSLRRAIDQFRAAVNERASPVPMETPLV